MKKLKYSRIILFLSIGFVSCETLPLEEEQYVKNIYLVNVEKSDIQYTVPVPYRSESSEIFISVGCGGSLVQDKDIEIVLGKADDAVISEYNHKHHRLEPEKNVHLLSEDRYDIPSWKTTLKANGETFSHLPVFVNVQGLHCDSTYGTPITILSTSDYAVNSELSTMLLAFDYYNAFSGSYSTTGTKQTGDELPANIFSTRTLKAVDEHTVRAFVGGITAKEDMMDTHSILLTLHEDNRVTVSGWNGLEAEDLGNGVYIPDKNIITVHYSYRNPTDQVVYVLSETFEKNRITN